MRISDWSSDVCSSDLRTNAFTPVERLKAFVLQPIHPLKHHTDSGEFIAVDTAEQEHTAWRCATRSRQIVSVQQGLTVDAGRVRDLQTGLQTGLHLDTTETCAERVAGDRKSAVWGKSVSVRV